MRNMDASKIIDALGGTAEVARLFRVKMPSVSAWRTSGIPKARLLVIEILHPELLAKPKRRRKKKAA